MVSFQEGDEVEVRSDEDGFVGAWFAAEVVHAGADLLRCVVEYAELLNDDGHPLQETVLVSNVRPRPPLLASPLCFRPGDLVEAYDRDGWWTGNVVDVTSPNKVSVYFRITSETMDFLPHHLRRHQAWEHGQWKDLTQAVRPDDYDDRFNDVVNELRSPDSTHTKLDCGKRKFLQSSFSRSLSSVKPPKRIDQFSRAKNTDRTLHPKSLSTDIPASTQGKWSLTNYESTTKHVSEVGEKAYSDTSFQTKALKLFRSKHPEFNYDIGIGLVAYKLLEHAFRMKTKGNLTWADEALLSNVRLRLEITNEEHALILQSIKH